MYVCMSTCYSAFSRFLLRGAPDYCEDAESEFHAEAHEQLRVKDLPRVPTRRLTPPRPSCIVMYCIVLYSTFILRPSHPQLRSEKLISDKPTDRESNPDRRRGEQATNPLGHSGSLTMGDRMVYPPGCSEPLYAIRGDK